MDRLFWRERRQNFLETVKHTTPVTGCRAPEPIQKGRATKLRGPLQKSVHRDPSFPANLCIRASLGILICTAQDLYGYCLQNMLLIYPLSWQHFAHMHFLSVRLRPDSCIRLVLTWPDPINNVPADPDAWLVEIPSSQLS